MPSGKKLIDVQGEVGEPLAEGLKRFTVASETLLPSRRGKLGPRKRANPTTLAAIRQARAGKTRRIGWSDF